MVSPDPAKPYAGGRDRASVTRMLQFVDNLVRKGLTAAWSGDLSHAIIRMDKKAPLERGSCRSIDGRIRHGSSAIILVNSSSVHARVVVVRTFPIEPRASANFDITSPSGASAIKTTSLCPVVKKTCLTSPPKLWSSSFAAAERFGASLTLRIRRIR